MVSPSITISTDLNNNCGGATTPLGTMQYVVYRWLYWMVQSAGGGGAASITRSSNGVIVDNSDLITGVGSSAIVFGASGAARSWATGPMPVTFGNVFGGGRYHFLIVAEDGSPLTPTSIRVSIAPGPFTGGTTTTLPTATNSSTTTFTLRSNTTIGAFRANFWKDQNGNIIYMGKLLVEPNAQAGLALIDPVTSTVTNRAFWMNAGGGISNITTWLVYVSAPTVFGFNSGTLISVSTGLTQLTNGIDASARMPAFPFTVTWNISTGSGGRLVGEVDNYLTIGGNAPSNFNYGDPLETGTMRYRTMGNLMLPVPIGTVLE